MKKIIIIFLFLSSFLYAQKSEFYKRMFGYNDTFWGESASQIITDKQISDNRSTKEAVILVEKSFMMSQETETIYYLPMNKLKAVGYKLKYSEETEKRLISKYNNIQKTLYYDSFNFNELSNEQKYIFLNSSTEEMCNSIYFYNDGNNKTHSILEVIEQVNKTEGTARIYKIDYNELTECYIFSNFIPEQIIVIYTEKYEEQF